MKMITSREMAANPDGLWKVLRKEGAIVVTTNGYPEALLVATSPETFLQDAQDVVFTRARRATQQMRQIALQNGGSDMSAEEVQEEISAVRKQL